MKVILFENVENLGLPGEIADVKPGYFRNFLARRGIAVEASPANLKSLEQKRKKLSVEAARIVKDSESISERMKGITLTFTLKAGENDRLFGSVTTADVAAQLATLGYTVDKRQIVIPTAIKSLGTFPARVKLEGNISATINLTVAREGKPVEDEAPAPEPEAPAAPETPAE